jgi:hypothetical protein
MIVAVEKQQILLIGLCVLACVHVGARALGRVHAHKCM